MTEYLYRVRITEYPEGSMEPIYYNDGSGEVDDWVPVRGWAPPGWKPEGNYVKLLGTTEFVWPTTRTLYRSRSGAHKRARLLESFGASAAIERSNRLVWPHDLTDWASHEYGTASDRGCRTNVDTWSLGTRLAFDVARFNDDPIQVDEVVSMYERVADDSHQFSLILAAALKFGANRVIGQLLSLIERGDADVESARSWLHEYAAYLWSTESSADSGQRA